jgi:hypothetical protein
MKKNIYFMLVIMLSMVNKLVMCSTPLEHEKAREQIMILKGQIQKKEKEYNIALQQALSETEKSQLTTQYTHNRQSLFKQIRQQRDIINDRSTEQWLWNTAKIVGPIAVAGLIAYKFFATSPTEIKPLIETNTILPDTSTIIKPDVQDLLPLTKPLEIEPAAIQTDMQHRLPLTKEEIQKYRNASKAYGVTTVWLAINALFDPFFYPYVAATFLGSLYYGVKGLDFKFKPISLEQIKIVPEEFPY